jgi:type III pantothenate kinase
MNLIIDNGNSCTKVAVFNNNELVEDMRFEQFSPEVAQSILQKYSDIQFGIEASVGESNPGSTAFLQKHLKKFISLNPETKLPIENGYDTKDTLGADRIAAAVAANHFFPQSLVLVIDAGSAITFEFIGAQGKYLGGNIAPGLAMRFKALHEFTAHLPLLDASREYKSPGNNTSSAIVAGVVQGMLHEIEGYITNCRIRHTEFKVIITGGDANFFAEKLNCSIFVNPNLVLVGLNQILEFNL